MRARPTYAAIVLVFFALIVAYTRAETARSDKLRDPGEFPEKSAIASPHTAKADCTACHTAHSLGDKHSSLSCDSCHFTPDQPDELTDPGNTCGNCHHQATEALPPLGIFRYPFSRNGNADLEGLLRPACSSCHGQEMAARSLPTLTHPTRSIGAHLSCLDCHDLFASELRPKTWTRADYASDWCFSCHEEQRRSFTLSDTHSLRRNTVSCAGCHPPHQPFAANLTVESFEMSGARELSAYDPIESNELCLRCHSYFELVNPESAFSLGSGLSLHDLHFNRAYASCVECHSPHGGSEGDEMIRRATLEGEPLLHFALDDTGSCSVICHDRHHISEQYLRNGD